MKQRMTGDDVETARDENPSEAVPQHGTNIVKVMKAGRLERRAMRQALRRRGLSYWKLKREREP